METTIAGPHERDLCQLGSIVDLVRTKQESPLHPGMAAEGVADAGRSICGLERSLSKYPFLCLTGRLRQM